MQFEPENTNDNRRRWSISTISAHAGMPDLDRAEDVSAEGLIPTVKPIYQSNTYLPASIDEMDRVFGGQAAGYVYGRYANPTVAELERVVALLEGAEPENTVAFASGMAALHATMLASGLGAGDRVVASRDLYGQTWALLNGQLRRLGIETTFVDVTNLQATLQAIRSVQPKLVVCETISNPLLRVAPVPHIAEEARAAGALLLVDNTFATPYLVHPAEYGADIVVHSATKFLSGHGDSMGGVAVAMRPEIAGELRRVRRDTGGILGPHDAWLIVRGIRTLPLRMQKQCENADAVAKWLSEQPGVASVNYPGLDPQPLRSLYGTPYGGAMVSFVVRGAGREGVFAFMESLRLITPATTLGDLSTLILYPLISSHRHVEATARAELGISDGLVRLSIGVESVDDIIEDLSRALAAAATQL